MLIIVFKVKKYQPSNCVNTFVENAEGSIVPSRPAIQTLRIKIATLFEPQKDEVITEATDIFCITPLVVKKFSHLPQPVYVTLEGDEVIIQYKQNIGTTS